MSCRQWRELVAARKESPLLPQIVGHTPQEAGYARSGNLWCCDAGAALSGRVAALVRDEGDADWSPVVLHAVESGARS